MSLSEDWIALWSNAVRTRTEQKRAHTAAREADLRAERDLLLSAEKRRAELAGLQLACADLETEIEELVRTREQAEEELRAMRRVRASRLLARCRAVAQTHEDRVLARLVDAWKSELPLNQFSVSDLQEALGRLGEPDRTQRRWRGELQRLKALHDDEGSVLAEVSRLEQELSELEQELAAVTSALSNHVDGSGVFEGVLGLYGVGARVAKQPLAPAALARIRDQVIVSMLSDIKAEDAWGVEPVSLEGGKR